MAENESIFISWSGPKSLRIAQTLERALKQIPEFKPVWSPQMPTGDQWPERLLEMLLGSRFCIACLTPDNLLSPWIHYEAGIVAGVNSGSRVCPYLCGVTTQQFAQASSPLALLQAVVNDRGGTLSLVQSINQGLPKPHDDTLLQSHFNALWPELQRELNAGSDGSGALSTAAEALKKELQSAQTVATWRDQGKLRIVVDGKQIAPNDPENAEKFAAAVQELRAAGQWPTDVEALE
jgi:hypothetical protein